MTKIVGILNVTPDSFSDGGKFFDTQAAVTQCHRLIEAGASIIDIGGQSSGPGSAPVGAQEELRRILPVISEISGIIPFGVDTYRGEVLKEVVQFKPVYVNDVSGGSDPVLLETAASADLEIILMHSKHKTMHDFSPEPDGDIVKIVIDSLQQKIKRAKGFGIQKERIVLDTGAGAFVSSKPEVCFELLNRYEEVLSAFDLPFMIAISRKGFLRKVANETNIDEVSYRYSRKFLLNSSVKYIRVHDPNFYFE